MENKDYEKKIANAMGVEPESKKSSFSKKNFTLKRFDNRDPEYGKYAGYQSNDANGNHPYFDKDTINQISNDMINKHGYPMKLSYDDKTDTFSHSELGGYEGKYKGEDVNTPEGKKRLYKFAPDWSWKESEDNDNGNDNEEKMYKCSWCEDEFPASELKLEKGLGPLCDQCKRYLETREGPNSLEFNKEANEEDFDNWEKNNYGK